MKTPMFVFIFFSFFVVFVFVLLGGGGGAGSLPEALGAIFEEGAKKDSKIVSQVVYILFGRLFWTRFAPNTIV